MTKEEKLVVINAIAEQLQAYPHFYIADIEALNAEQTAALRRKCYESDIKLVVVKNTLLAKALAGVARANELGGRLKQRLEAIRSTTPEIADIRGPGFMVAVEFANPANHEPDSGFTTRVRVEAQKRGLILLSCGVYANVIRVLVPLVASDALLDEGLDIMAASLAAALA